MAWQLIYTSAPRLLEAGRTGFGTVARHRAVSGMLVSTVERFSQFARLPGHDPRRVVHTYRILTVGSGTYHVFSCLQDAGSDYTGRTNHIAHHVIAEAREIRAAAAVGLTPADVLIAFPWRAAWSEGPRYLDPAEEVALSTLTIAPSHAWAAITGNAHSALLPWSQSAFKGCYLLLPGTVNALELFRESLLAAPQQAWQTSFTTCLEPNDDVADFRWIGLATASTMRGQVETSARLVLDLSQPATLPPLTALAPPELEQPVSAPANDVIPPFQELSSPTRQPAKERLRAPVSEPAPANTMGGWSPEPRKARAPHGKGVIIMALVAAVIAILATVGGLLWHSSKQQDQAAKDQLKLDVAKLWKEHQLDLNETQQWLEGLDISQDKSILGEYKNFFKQMKEVLASPGTESRLDLPSKTKDDVAALARALQAWQKLHSKKELPEWGNEFDPLKLKKSWEDWKKNRTKAWSALTGIKQPQPPPPPETHKMFVDKAKLILKDARSSEGKIFEWQQLFKALSDSTQPIDQEAERWLTQWSKLEGGDLKVLTGIENDPHLPEWLKQKAKSKHALAEKQENDRMLAEADQKTKQTAAPTAPKVEPANADSTAGLHEILIHILRGNESPESRLKDERLPLDPKMQIYVGNLADLHPAPTEFGQNQAGALKRWKNFTESAGTDLIYQQEFNSLQDSIIKFSPLSLIKIPKDQEGTRLVARSKDGIKVLFDIRIISPDARKPPIFSSVLTTPVINSPASVQLPEVGKLLKRLKFIGQPNLTYKLRFEASSKSVQKVYDLSANGDAYDAVMPIQAQDTNSSSKIEIQRQLNELKEGVTSLEKQRDAIAPKLAGREAKIKDLNDKIAEKNIKISGLEGQQKQQPLNQPVLIPKLEGGTCTIFTTIGTDVVMDICKLQLVPTPKPPGNSPPKP